MSRSLPRRSSVILVLLALAGIGLTTVPAAADTARLVPPPEAETAMVPGAPAVAVFAGGCFWGVQGVFQHVQGVTNAVSGYAGGDKATAEYEKVSAGRTKHAEAVRITYDPAKISYGRLLQIFFSVAHDPTELDRQGPDVGPHYRSAIFPADAAQADLAKAYIAQLDKARAFPSPIVTRIETGHAFYPAEAYHQDFMTRHPTYPYIVIHDLPKIDSLKRLFPALYRADPVLVAKAGIN